LSPRHAAATKPVLRPSRLRAFAFKDRFPLSHFSFSAFSVFRPFPP
jgi:hypothetical protein